MRRGLSGHGLTMLERGMSDKACVLSLVVARAYNERIRMCEATKLCECLQLAITEVIDFERHSQARDEVWCVVLSGGSERWRGTVPTHSLCVHWRATTHHNHHQLTFFSASFRPLHRSHCCRRHEGGGVCASASGAAHGRRTRHTQGRCGPKKRLERFWILESHHFKHESCSIPASRGKMVG